MSPARQRVVAARVLAALPYRTGCRCTVLEVLFRRGPDAMLPDLLRHLRREAAAQRRFLSLDLASRASATGFATRDGVTLYTVKHAG